MKLTQEQIKAYDEEGYILLPSLFSQQEAALMKSRLPALFQMNRDEVIKEKSGVVRTVFAAHTFDDVFARVACHPRLINPARQLLTATCTCTSSRSMPKLRSMVMSGNGTRILAPGIRTMACPRRGP